MLAEAMRSLAAMRGLRRRIHTSGSMIERGLRASIDEGGLVSRGGTGIVRDMFSGGLDMSRLCVVEKQPSWKVESSAVLAPGTSPYRAKNFAFQSALHEQQLLLGVQHRLQLVSPPSP
jgi:hypothetical protein